jgi:hypothetical protein
MIPLFLALAGLVLPAPDISTAPAEQKRAKSAKAAKASAPKPEAPKLQPSLDATRVADWVASAKDNHALPYIVIDKNNASAFLFDGKGKAIASAPVLIGIAPGDDATPGIGSKNLAEIGPAEKTTPAGRFLAKFGLAAGKERVLWVDYSTSVAIHMIPKTSPKKERRRERMLSATSEDNRITFGCINVPIVFYTRNLRPLFQRKGGYVYIMPDTKPIEEVFPRLRVEALKNNRVQ